MILESNYQTVNLFLPKVWRIKYVLVKKSRYQNEYIKVTTLRINNKFGKHWGEYNLLMAIIAMLDLRFKMELTQFCFPVIFRMLEDTRNIEFVLKVLA